MAPPRNTGEAPTRAGMNAHEHSTGKVESNKHRRQREEKELAEQQNETVDTGMLPYTLTPDSPRNMIPKA